MKGKSSGVFTVIIGWPKSFGKYGESSIKDEHIDDWILEKIGSAVRLVSEFDGVELGIAPSIPGRDRKRNPVISTRIVFTVETSKAPKEWSKILLSKIRRIEGVMSAR